MYFQVVKTTKMNTIKTQCQYGFNIDKLGAKFLITIHNIIDDIAYAKPPSYDGVEQLEMTFDIYTGEGIGKFTGTFLTIEEVH